MHWAQLLLKSRMVHTALFVTHLNPSAKLETDILLQNVKLWLLANFTRHFKQYLLGRKFQIVDDHRALQWFYNFEDSHVLTTRWLEKLAAFQYEIVHLSGKSIRNADSVSRISSQDATADQANAFTRSAEAKHPTQTNDEASNTEWPNRSRKDEEKTCHLPEKTNEAKFAATASLYATECWFRADSLSNGEIKKNELVEMSGDLFDFTDSIAHKVSSDFELVAGIAKQIRKVFPTTYPEFGWKTSKEKIYVQQLSLNRFICHLIVKPSFWNKLTYSSLRAALEVMWQHAKKLKSEKIIVSKMSAGLDELI